MLKSSFSTNMTFGLLCTTTSFIADGDTVCALIVRRSKSGEDTWTPCWGHVTCRETTKAAVHGAVQSKRGHRMRSDIRNGSIHIRADGEPYTQEVRILRHSGANGDTVGRPL